MTVHPVEARIVVGMPVFNAESTVADAISSITAYPGDDLRLLISDNASVDQTSTICRQFAERDRRIVVVTQKQNLGAEANFDHVLQAARCRYFMWAASDDTRSPDFIELCTSFLDQHSEYVGATCPVRFDGMSFDQVAMGDGSLEDADPYERMLGFFGGMHANGRFYSLFRREAIKGWLEHDKNYLGADWTLVLRMLHEGKMKRMESGWVMLGAAGASRRLTIFSRYRKRRLHWLLPFLDLSREAVREFVGATPSQNARLIGRLARINVLAAIMQKRYDLLLRTKRHNGVAAGI